MEKTETYFVCDFCKRRMRNRGIEVRTTLYGNYMNCCVSEHCKDRLYDFCVENVPEQYWPMEIADA